MATDHVRLLPTSDGSADLQDIVTSEDSLSAADFIMRSLRKITEDPTTRVIASIAGGRKTMAAILASCMVLLGRSQDRLCHVLVNPPLTWAQHFRLG
jgi:CRISPR-associated protein (TIGR02584 family)